jgi:hypothetical protein
VQLTREEFLRQLPDAIGDMSFRDEGNEIVIGDSTKSVRIKLADLGTEDIGSLHLPMQQVDFRFQNMATGEIESFMTRWDEHKLRMGG